MGTVIVGTAGHIDHGKTSMVRALTGVELDTLPEERDRGITIALGFTSLTLPDGQRVAMVDVPGHERLVRTMISGAHGLRSKLIFTVNHNTLINIKRHDYIIIGELFCLNRICWEPISKTRPVLKIYPGQKFVNWPVVSINGYPKSISNM